ncbi:hypothetical protein [Pantoea sp. GM_Pan_4]|uniref:hypothetical protein n=1 Tax=Pantoea sp. GM_Pan_4 TaxID=2937389 RepID=UPI00226A4AFA|nr:hypothetical protein [Pantoea sp. GM_Pan_4]
MLTFKHFCDRPTWAAAAGYNFNIIDCLSEAMLRINVLKGIKDILAEIPDLELREAWYKLPISALAICLAMSWPLIFWLFGIVTYARCVHAKRKYAGTEDETVLKNLRVWLKQFERGRHG